MIKNDEDPGSHTQNISLFVGGLMAFLSLWGIFFNVFLGVPAYSFYWAAFGLGGALLFYFGYQDYRKSSIVTCLILGTYFLVMGIINFLQLPIHSEMSFILANHAWQGSADYLLSLIISFFLYAGAYDWYRRYKHKPVRQKKFNPILK